MNNLMQIAQLMRGKNPQSIVMDMFNNQQITDPNISKLIQLAQQGDTVNFKNLAETLFKSRGLDLNKELTQFMSFMK